MGLCSRTFLVQKSSPISNDTIKAMKLFIDSANPTEIKEIWDLGIIEGVTTNPTLATKAGVDYKTAVDEIIKTVDGDISLEVLATDAPTMIKEAQALASLNSKVVVKLPTTEEGLKALKILEAQGIRINMTLVFSATQALLVAKLGAYFVSPFVGRLDDIGEVGMDLIGDIRQIYDNFGFETQILSASIRNENHVKQAALIGSDIATCPYTVLKKLVAHPLTDKGVKQFLDDFKKSGQKPLV